MLEVAAPPNAEIVTRHDGHLAMKQHIIPRHEAP
jgi:hypothetical protein